MNAQSQTDSYNSNWELTGELELPLSSAQNEKIHDWLNITLEPHQLHEDICRRVEISMQEAVARALATDMGSHPQHVHLKIYLPTERESKGNNWSFFRVEKTEEYSHNGQISDHAIELYLYLETH